MSNVEVADDIIGVIRQVIGQFSMKNLETESIEVPVSVKLWRVPGCHELLASLGMKYLYFLRLMSGIYTSALWHLVVCKETHIRFSIVMLESTKKGSSVM
jgi:hypothetical protein